MFLYTSALKIAINEKKINQLDICLVRTLVALVFSFLITVVGQKSFFVEPNLRKVLLLRSVLGTIGFTTLTFGVALVPLVVQNSIFNTAPFWATALGYLILNEKIGILEIFAMILSFAAVLTISVSQARTELPPEEEQTAHTKSGSLKFLGCSLIFFVSIIYATVSVLTRKMQSIYFSLVLFYYSCVAFVITFVIVSGECLIKGQAYRFGDYSQN